jgi:hypothetical protein
MRHTTYAEETVARLQGANTSERGAGPLTSDAAFGSGGGSRVSGVTCFVQAAHSSAGSLSPHNQHISVNAKEPRWAV